MNQQVKKNSRAKKIVSVLKVGNASGPKNQLRAKRSTSLRYLLRYFLL